MVRYLSFFGFFFLVLLALILCGGFLKKKNRGKKGKKEKEGFAFYIATVVQEEGMTLWDLLKRRTHRQRHYHAVL